MRNEKTKPSKREYFWERFLPENDPETIHYLSPLAHAALEHKVQTFTYPFNGIELVIERHVADAIYRNSRDYIKRMKATMQMAKLKHLKRDPAIRLFLKKPFRTYTLPTRLYNTLTDYGCKNMEDVALKWHNELLNGQSLGKGSLQLLISIFDKHGCLTLCL